MNAVIISVGKELLLGETLDTNSAWLSDKFSELGVHLNYRITVDDNVQEIASAISDASKKADLIILIGGLGPTLDDVTRDALAHFLNEKLEIDQEAKCNLKAIFKRRGIKISQNQLRQVMKPLSCKFLTNQYGTAPGIFGKSGTAEIYCLPGPPREFKTVAEKNLLPNLKESENNFLKKEIRIIGIGEGALENELQETYQKAKCQVATYANESEIRIRLSSHARSQKEAEEQINPTLEEFKQKLGSKIYTIGQDSLASILVKKLQDAQLTVSVAESCTGGLLGSKFAQINGASNVFLGGIQSYSHEAKVNLLRVNESTIKQYGTVSPEVALEMANGVRQLLGSDIALSITGVAGDSPLDESPELKEPGLVYIGYSDPTQTIAKSFLFLGKRENILDQAAQRALQTLYFESNLGS